MINEFYAGLLLYKPAQSLNIWDDYIDPNFKLPSRLDPALTTLQDLIVGDSRRQEGLAWRMLHVANLIKQSDLANLLSYFDAREGFNKEDIIKTLAFYFNPRITGDLVELPTAISGTALSTTYRLIKYALISNNNELNVSRVGSSDVKTYTWGSQTHLNVELQGTAGLIIVPKFIGSSFIEWASRPTYTFVSASQNLSKNKTLLEKLKNLQSVFEAEVLNILVDLALDPREPVAQVLAAGLLLSGSVVSYVKH